MEFPLSELPSLEEEGGGGGGISFYRTIPDTQLKIICFTLDGFVKLV